MMLLSEYLNEKEPVNEILGVLAIGALGGAAIKHHMNKKNAAKDQEVAKKVQQTATKLKRARMVRGGKLGTMAAIGLGAGAAVGTGIGKLVSDKNKRQRTAKIRSQRIMRYRETKDKNRAFKMQQNNRSK